MRNADGDILLVEIAISTGDDVVDQYIAVQVQQRLDAEATLKKVEASREEAEASREQEKAFDEEYICSEGNSSRQCICYCQNCRGMEKIECSGVDRTRNLCNMHLW